MGEFLWLLLCVSCYISSLLFLVGFFKVVGSCFLGFLGELVWIAALWVLLKDIHTTRLKHGSVFCSGPCHDDHHHHQHQQASWSPLACHHQQSQQASCIQVWYLSWLQVFSGWWAHVTHPWSQSRPVGEHDRAPSQHQQTTKILEVWVEDNFQSYASFQNVPNRQNNLSIVIILLI